MIRFRSYIIFCCSIWMLWSCGTIMYFPPKANVPLFREQEEAKLNMSTSLSSIDLQGSYSLNKNLFFAASMNYFYPTGMSVGEEEIDLTIFQFDIAPGIYFPVRQKTVFEMQGGYGYGTLNDPEYNLQISKFYIQPALGYVHRKGEIGFVLRYVHVVPDHFSTNSAHSFSTEDYLEPIIVMRLGIDNFKLTGQFGYSFEYDFVRRYWNHYDEKVHNLPFIIYLGVQYHIINNPTE